MSGQGISSVVDSGERAVRQFDQHLTRELAALQHIALRITEIVVRPGKELKHGPNQLSVVGAPQDDWWKWQAGRVTAYNSLDLLDSIKQIYSILGQANIGQMRS
jgi:hypothetical protein